MSDATSPVPISPATPEGLNPVTVFSALGSEIRWPILQLLADGIPRTATDVAAVVQGKFDTVSKHLRLMRDAGVVDASPGADRRLVVYSVPAEFRQNAGVLDFGVCRLPMPSAKMTVAKD